MFHETEKSLLFRRAFHVNHISLYINFGQGKTIWIALSTTNRRRLFPLIVYIIQWFKVFKQYSLAWKLPILQNFPTPKTFQCFSSNRVKSW